MPETPLLNHRYQLLETLGSGGMSVVYRAEDSMLTRPVAIKVLRENYSRDVSFRERFTQEARAVANLSHPNIVTVHDFGLDEGQLFIVMEYVPGTDLKTLLLNRGRFSVAETLLLMEQACAGVGYAHRAGLVHCDIKPHNILVTPDERVKVTDFGIARALATIQPDEHNEVIWGSPQYFSPEQASGKAPSPASDVYSLGVILYEMVTGRLPFIGSTPEELARMHRDDAPLPPRQIDPSIPIALEQIILKALSKEPTARYRKADQLGRVLMSIDENASQPVYPAANAATIEMANVANPIYSTTSETSVSTGTALPEEDGLNVDWITIGLGLLTLLAVGGLIPFWLAVWFTINPIVH
jgi:serine/threonine-protein kinase